MDRRLIFMRSVAQLIDIVVGFAILAGALIWVPRWVLGVFDQPVVAAVAALCAAVGGCFLIQYPFLVVGQTIGKALCALEVVATDGEPLSVARLLRRELLMKLATLYFICFPALLGQLGGHDEACHTQVIRKQVRGR